MSCGGLYLSSILISLIFSVLSGQCLSLLLGCSKIFCSGLSPLHSIFRPQQISHLRISRIAARNDFLLNLHFPSKKEENILAWTSRLQELRHATKKIGARRGSVQEVDRRTPKPLTMITWLSTRLYLHLTSVSAPHKLRIVSRSALQHFTWSHCRHSLSAWYNGPCLRTPSHYPSSTTTPPSRLQWPANSHCQTQRLFASCECVSRVLFHGLRSVYLSNSRFQR